MRSDRSDSGDGFQIVTDNGANELVLRLSPSLAGAVGALAWRALQDQPVDDRRVVLAAALCNLSEFMQANLIGRKALTD